MSIIYRLNELEVPKDIAQINGPFEEFKQDVKEMIDGVVGMIIEETE